MDRQKGNPLYCTHPVRGAFRLLLCAQHGMSSAFLAIIIFHPNTAQLCLPIYNNDVYTTQYGASVFAASTFMRFIISASFPLFTVQMIERLSFAWATSLLGFITVAMIPIPWVFWKWGPKLRGRTTYLKHLQAVETVEEK